MRLTPLLYILWLLAPDARAQEPTGISAETYTLGNGLQVIKARLGVQRDSFAIMVEGIPLGWERSVLERTAEGFRYTEATRLGGFLEQDTEILTDARLNAIQVSQRGAVQGQQTRIEVRFEDGRARGTATTPTPEGSKSVTIDTPVPGGTLEENLVQPLLPALPWAPDASWTFTVFSSVSGEFRQVSLAVSGAAPTRIVKIGLSGTPIEIVRAAP